MARRVSPPDDYEGYKDVKAALPGVLLFTAEHEYTRMAFDGFYAIGAWTFCSQT